MDRVAAILAMTGEERVDAAKRLLNVFIDGSIPSSNASYQQLSQLILSSYTQKASISASNAMSSRIY